MAIRRAILTSEHQKIAVLDANVLYPPLLRDILLVMALRRMYQARWSDEILGEVERNLARQIGHATAQERVDGMRSLLPEAMVTDYSSHLPNLLNNHKDRHVVAVGLKGQASLIITSNLKDFQRLPLGINAVLPDDFLCGFLDHSEVLLACLEEVRTGWPRPPALGQLFLGLDRLAPQFVHQMRRIQAA